jgi:hypothetical protein
MSAWLRSWGKEFLFTLLSVLVSGSLAKAESIMRFEHCWTSSPTSGSKGKEIKVVGIRV